MIRITPADITRLISSIDSLSRTVRELEGECRRLPDKIAEELISAAVSSVQAIAAANGEAGSSAPPPLMPVQPMPVQPTPEPDQQSTDPIADAITAFPLPYQSTAKIGSTRGQQRNIAWAIRVLGGSATPSQIEAVLTGVYPQSNGTFTANRIESLAKQMAQSRVTANKDSTGASVLVEIKPLLSYVAATDHFELTPDGIGYTNRTHSTLIAAGRPQQKGT